MLHVEQEAVRRHLLEANFGLERENLRVDAQGNLALTPHPFPDNPHIVRDFCENQTEINTDVTVSAQGAVQALAEHDLQIRQVLATLPNPEYLWPFSNPPHIRSEKEVPIARYYGDQAWKTAYREYLSDRYGGYKMTLCGIHVNISLGDNLLQADFAQGTEQDFRAYRDRLYLDTAQQAVRYGWILTALTAASPVMDSSYVEKGNAGGDLFQGMASVRCSELGYWNAFTPVLRYDSLATYADSIQRYVDDGLLLRSSELYYPVRIKPRGENLPENLKNGGASHIELRMFDLNPLAPAGVDARDVEFARLFLLWCAATPAQPLSERDQIQAAQNFKNAAHYDLKTVKIILGSESLSVVRAGRHLLREMRAFYQEVGLAEQTAAVLDFEQAKLDNPGNRYAWQVRHQFAPGYVEKGLQLALDQQKTLLNGLTAKN